MFAAGYSCGSCLPRHPIKYENHPDPGALCIDGGLGGFIVISTSNYELSSETGPAFPILWSADLVSWNLVRYKKIG